MMSKNNIRDIQHSLLKRYIRLRDDSDKSLNQFCIHTNAAAHVQDRNPFG